MFFCLLLLVLSFCRDLSFTFVWTVSSPCVDSLVARLPTSHYPVSDQSMHTSANYLQADHLVRRADIFEAEGNAAPTEVLEPQEADHSHLQGGRSPSVGDTSRLPPSSKASSVSEVETAGLAPKERHLYPCASEAEKSSLCRRMLGSRLIRVLNYVCCYLAVPSVSASAHQRKALNQNSIAGRRIMVRYRRRRRL